MGEIIDISSIEEIVDLLLKHNHLVIEHGWFDDRFHFMTLDLNGIRKVSLKTLSIG